MTPDLSTEKISISLPGALLRAIDNHLKPNESRSGYIQIIVKRDLEEKGVLTPAGSETAPELEAVIQGVKLLGFTDEQLAAHISTLTRQRAAEPAGSR